MDILILGRANLNLTLILKNLENKFVTGLDNFPCHCYDGADKKTCQIAKGNCQRRKKMPLHNHLKEFRAKLGVNQQEMGALVGTSRQTISQIERGDYSPSVTLALKIAKICNATVEEIFEYEEDETDEK